MDLKKRKHNHPNKLLMIRQGGFHLPFWESFLPAKNFNKSHKYPEINKSSISLVFWVKISNSLSLWESEVYWILRKWRSTYTIEHKSGSSEVIRPWPDQNFPSFIYSVVYSQDLHSNTWLLTLATWAASNSLIFGNDWRMTANMYMISPWNFGTLRKSDLEKNWKAVQLFFGHTL